MRQKETKQLYDYWMRLFWETGNQPGMIGQPIWPQRRSVHPSQCRSLLGDMFILEIVDDRLIYRLAGTRLCALHGRELKGLEFTDPIHSEDRISAKNWAIRTGIEGYIAIMSSAALDSVERPHAMETILLPLASNSDQANRILGLTVDCDRRMRTRQESIGPQNVTSVRTLRPWQSKSIGSADSQRSRATSGFQSHADLQMLLSQTRPPSMITPLEDGADQPRQVQHLRVYQGGRSKS
ncbi:MAG: PAS domain-containing protein [Ahrensia sp.]|nr:PAS domain-containing protein [Ahrensia sp.]